MLARVSSSVIRRVVYEEEIVISAQQAAGGLYIASAFTSYFFFREIEFLQIVIAAALLWFDDPNSSGILRFIVLCWVIFALALISVAIYHSGYWLALVPTLLFAGSVAALMLENLEKRTVIILSAIGVTGIGLSLFI
jgi:hypothetical protein